MVAELVEQEILRAEDAARALDLPQWFPFIACDPDAEHEAAMERAAIAGEGGGVGGLVSVPTTHKRSAAKAAAASDALRARLRANRLVIEPARIARMRRGVGFAARAHLAGQRPGFRADYVAMVTLTYADGDDWRPEHITAFCNVVRAWCKRHGVSFRYVWVAELQKRGALHYHLALWLPPGVSLPKPDQCGWWPHGHTRIEAAKGAVQYLLKYLSKGTDLRTLPRGARMHAAGGLEHTMRRARRWLGLPSFVQSRADLADDWRRAPGGGWIDPDGVHWASEYQRAYVGDSWAVVRVADHGRPFPADGPYSRLERSPWSS